MKRFFVIGVFLSLFGATPLLLVGSNYHTMAILIILPQRQELNVWLPKNTEFLLNSEFNDRDSICNKISFNDFKKRFSENGIVSYSDSDYPYLIIKKSDLNGNCYMTFQHIDKPNDWQKGIEIETIKLEYGKFFVYPYNNYKSLSYFYFGISLMFFLISILLFFMAAIRVKRLEEIKKEEKIINQHFN